MNLDAYLARIASAGPRAPDAETLRRLHRAHLFAVPFENLDIGRGRAIQLEPQALFDKIVVRRRGGFCYELNGLFAWLLEAHGFAVTLVSARPYSDGAPLQEFDHLALLVSLPERWLVDVGFGDSFLEPLPLDAAAEWPQAGRMYRLRDSGADWRLQSREPNGDWRTQYQFSLQPRRLAEFEPMCRYHQTSPDSPFTRKDVCSLPVAGGRLTLSGRRLIQALGGQRQEIELATEAEVATALQTHFGIVLA